jgi:hypothetical protein
VFLRERIAANSLEGKFLIQPGQNQGKGRKLVREQRQKYQSKNGLCQVTQAVSVEPRGIKSPSDGASETA